MKNAKCKMKSVKVYLCKKHSMHFTRILLIAFLLWSFLAYSQKSDKDAPASIPMFYGFYGYQWPGADMAERFGSNSVIGPGFLWKTSANWLWGAEYHYLFGNNTKEGFQILEEIMTSAGNIISGDGTPAVVALFERGNILGVRFGKLVPVTKKDRNSGIFFTAGGGFMNHKIRIDVENQSAPQLKGDYKRGYDRLSGGVYLSQSVGFIYFGQRKLMNFMVSVDIFEGFIKGQRDYNFDTMQPGDEKRFDLLIGPKIAWILPIRKRMAQEFYYY